ncbi:hypothetical protein [Amycolatopsis benzoatilytica]|uniref:hypothetical protein n=1 Tax=Amycolatopsis benzoatilytica TaxID=346045 RepID=UPI0012B6A437|nr:hypothetical protein [Amycolatopsis benzoatilytica]
MRKGLTRPLAATVVATALLLTGMGTASASAGRETGNLQASSDKSICKIFKINGGTVADVCFYFDKRGSIHPPYTVTYKFNKLSWGGYLPDGHVAFGEVPGRAAQKLKATGNSEIFPYQANTSFKAVVCHQAGCSDALEVKL